MGRCSWSFFPKYHPAENMVAKYKSDDKIMVSHDWFWIQWLKQNLKIRVNTTALNANFNK